MQVAIHELEDRPWYSESFVPNYLKSIPVAYCLSLSCLGRKHEDTRSLKTSINSIAPKKVIKRNVTRYQFDCPDCKCALIWARE